MNIRDLANSPPRPALPNNLQGQGEYGVRYEVLDRLGEGAAGVVYTCRPLNVDQRESSPTFAVKIFWPLQRIVPTDGAYERLRLRFVQEGTRSRHLTYPNLPTIVDTGLLSSPPFADHPFYVMQLVNGDPLHRLFDSKAPPLGEKLAWATTLANTVAFLHAHGVYHRDIKPANVLIERDTRKLFLTDFGVLHWGDFAKAYTDGIQTYSSEVLTTWNYLPPEVEVNPNQYDASADAWSLGKTLAEMFAWQQIPRSLILTGLFDLTTSTESPFCAGIAKSLIAAIPDDRSPIQRAIGRLAWYSRLWSAIRGLKNESFATAAEAVQKAVKGKQQQLDLESLRQRLRRLQVSRLPEDFADWQHVLDYVDTWQRPQNPCPRCGSECIIRFHYTEYDDGGDYAEYVCLGSPDRTCAHVWSS